MQKTQGFLFQHMDSRGGSTFIAKTSFYEAMESYVSAMGWEITEGEPGWTKREIWDSAYFDLIGPAVLLHQEPLEEGELLAEMLTDGKGWNIAKLRQEFKGRVDLDGWESPGFRWIESDESVSYYYLYKGNDPIEGDEIFREKQVLEQRYIVSNLHPRMDDDAYGLIFQY